MATRQDWGQALQGAGAWWAGQGPQYEQSRAAAEETAFLKDKRREDALVHDFAVAYQMGINGQFDAADKFLQSREGFIKQLGGDTYHTAGVRERLKNPATRESILQELEPYYISMQMSGGQANNQKGQTFAVTNPETGELEMVGSVFDPSTGQWTAQRVGLGGGEMVGASGVPPSQRPMQKYREKSAEQGAVADTAAEIELQRVRGANIGAGGGGGAPSSAQLAADAQAARDKAAAGVERDTQAKVTEKSGRMLEAAANLVLDAFSNVNTGPIAGRVPAAVRDAAAYQTAEGAAGQYRAQMRKIIRPPGSGPWTDLDEQKLDAIVPNLQDTPEAVAAKISQGRALYQAQIGEGSSSGGAEIGKIVTVGNKKYRIVGGDPNDPDVEEVR